MALIRSRLARWSVSVLVATVAWTAAASPATAGADRHGEKIVTGSAQKCERDAPTSSSGGPCPDLGSLPGMVALVDASQPDNFLGQFCGGTLIDAFHVLTAAHCLGGTIDVLVGTSSLAGGGQRVRVVSQYGHPGFELGRVFHDLAVLRLGSPVSGPVVELLGPADTAEAAPATPAELFGWGGLNVDEGQQAFPDDLRTVALPIAEDGACSSVLQGDYDSASEVCAGVGTIREPAADACRGDSGGPLLVVTSAGRRQVGVVSRGPTCGQSPTAYTDVRAFADFLTFTRSLTAAAFTDTAGSVHEVSIEVAVREGIIEGNDGRFRPGDPVSRGAAAKIVAGALGFAERPGPSQFTDTAGNVFEGWINAAVDGGLMQGVTPTRFDPGANLTRAQVATLLARALRLQPREGDEFVDVGGPPHGPNIYALVDAAVTVGFDDGTYRPGFNVSRGQLATFLVRGVPSLRFGPAE
jgi:hypothetical protein